MHAPHVVSLYKPTHREPLSFPVDAATRAPLHWNPAWTGVGGAHVPDRHPMWDENARINAESRAALAECHFVTTDGEATNWGYWCLTHDGGSQRPDRTCF